MKNLIPVIDSTAPTDDKLTNFVSHWLSNVMPKHGLVKMESVPHFELGKLISKSDNLLIKNHILNEENKKLENKLKIALIALENYSMLLDTWNSKIKVSNTAMRAIEMIKSIK